jgi:broad specificity phosphatase PhoE
VSLNRVEPRIREQEFGNKQDETFTRLREDQMSVGRFWYRFPTGESGADVYDRVKQWWNDELM